MIKHVVFDVFGTLLNTGTGSVDATRKILENIGSDRDPASFYKEWKALRKDIMMNAATFQTEKYYFGFSLDKMFRKYGIEKDAWVEVKPMIDSLFSVRKIFPEVEETIEGLKDMGITVAIGSTSDTDTLMYYLESNNVQIENIFSSEMIQAYKPEEVFYRTILSTLGWKADECIFIGDTYIDDVLGPDRVGFTTVLIDRKHAYDNVLLEPKPDYTVYDLRDLFGIIRKENEEE